MTRVATTKKPKKAADRDAAKMAKALTHPLRVAILYELARRTASPVDLARSMCEPLGNVSYHVRTLRELGCIELADTRQRRGAIEHFYRATTRPEADGPTWDKLDEDGRRAFALAWFRGSFTEAATAIDAGRFADDQVHFSLTPVELDDDGWTEIHDDLRSVLEKALELQAKATSEGTARRSGRLVLAQFEAAKRAEDD